MPPVIDPNPWWQYGAVGGVAAILLSLIVWIIVTLFKRLLVHFDDLKIFMESCTRSLQKLTDGQVDAARRSDDITVRLNDIAARRRGF